MAAGMDPRLPEDLKHAIFEHVAITEPEMMPALMLVARRVHTWITPLVFRTVRLNNWPHALAFLHAVLHRPAAVLPHVRHLALEGRSAGPLLPADVLERIVARCPNLHALGTTPHYDKHAALLPALAAGPGRLRNVTTVLRHALGTGGADSLLPAFAHVTHLCLLDEITEQPARAAVCAALPGLAALTHVRLTAIQYARRPGVAADLLRDLGAVLRRVPALRVLLVTGVTFGPAALQLGAADGDADIRLVFAAVSHDYARFWRAWEDTLRGRVPDLWARAEEFVQAKREGRINAAEMWLAPE
ncbi:hypothetical protein MIND_01165000 [Mycena indigotica]|uniref:Uncharacterized protein n=1 Tax=Mycena indigotica TaxID=2126181 RepID=A0A8H6VWG1_9AGAR|nr:uncharacterized protein MIND_01165000 [Mycena indigotica]KAF7292668.1 hypothetical protein MIND_01165000 [Mycena indigotica]